MCVVAILVQGKPLLRFFNMDFTDLPFSKILMYSVQLVKNVKN